MGEQRREQRLAAGRPDVRVDGVFGVGHQADHVPGLIPDAGDPTERPVRVVVVGRLAVGPAVAEHDPTVGSTGDRMAKAQYKIALFDEKVLTVPEVLMRIRTAGA